MNSEERLQTLEEKVLALEKEVTQLKLQLSKATTDLSAPDKPTQPISNVPARLAQPVANVPARSVQPATNVPARPVQPATNVPARPVQPVANAASRKSSSKNNNLEAAIGKNVIGILASILFFIAFIVFGTFIYQNLGNMGKSILLFAGSFLMTGIGLLLQNKLKNAFSLSVISCGMGCFFITLIINTVYFEFLSELGLYFSLLLWLFAMSFLSKKLESTLLSVIGQCGLYISILFGVINGAKTVSLWFAFFVFFLIADIFYLRICDVEKQKTLHTFSTIGTVISCILFAFRNKNLYCSYIEEHSSYGVTTFYFVIALALLAYSFYRFHQTAKQCIQKGQSSHSLLAAGYFLGTLLIFRNMINMIQAGICEIVGTTSTTFKHGFLLLFCFVSIFYLEYLEQKYKNSKFDNFIVLFDVPYLVLQLVLCIAYLELTKYFLLLLVAVPLLYYGFSHSKKIYQGCGLTVLFIHIILSREFPLLHFILTLGVLLFAFWLQKKYLESYSGITKVFMYLMWLFYFLLPAKDMEQFLTGLFGESNPVNSSMLYVLFLTPFQIIALKSSFTRNYRDLSRSESYMVCFVRGMNIFLLISGTSMLHRELPLPLYLLFVIVTSVLCFLGIKEFFQKYPRQIFPGFYMGIKFTLYLTSVFNSTPISNKILLSILLLCIAICSILSGFNFKLKSLRIYGLSLTMLSVVKLTLFDIDYGSALGTVAALVICGILCFIINFIYNMLSKQIVTEEDFGKNNKIHGDSQP